jgi:divalent metal cation (Fe/Co/Zn/Cd) transporter
LFLAIGSYGLLTGEAADLATRAGILRIATAEAGVERVNESLTMHFGPDDVLAALSLDFRNDLTADEVEQTVSRIEAAIRREFPHVRRSFVEAQSLAAHAQAQLAGPA